jgi:hypothetical protein
MSCTTVARTADSGFTRLLRVNNIVDRVRGFLHVSLQVINGCFARSASRLRRVLEFRESVRHVVEGCSYNSQRAMSVHYASSLRASRRCSIPIGSAISCRFCSEAGVPSVAMRPEAQEGVRSSMSHARPRRSCARSGPFAVATSMSPADDRRTGHDADVELRRRRQVRDEDITALRERRGRLMEEWHSSLESSRSVLARLSWIEQAATRARARVSLYGCPSLLTGSETDCARDRCAAEDARCTALGDQDSEDGPPVVRNGHQARPRIVGTRLATPGASPPKPSARTSNT